MHLNNETNTLVFILPLINHTTMLTYSNERVEILDMNITTYFSSKGAVKQNGYKAAMYFDDMYFYPSTGINNPECCWLHMDEIIGKNTIYYSELLQKYHKNISAEQLSQMYTKIIKLREAEKRVLLQTSG